MSRMAKNDVGLERVKTGPVNSGINGNRYTDRDGIWAMADRKLAIGKAQTRENQLGSGSLRMKFYDDDNNPITEDGIIKIGGLVFRGDKAGMFRLVDEGVLIEEKREIDELEDYVDSVVEYCVSDSLMMRIFGWKPENLTAHCAPVGKGGVATKQLAELKMSAGLADFDCTPSYIRSLVPQSQLWAGAVSKLRFLVDFYRPTIQKQAQTGTTESHKSKTTPAMDLVGAGP